MSLAKYLSKLAAESPELETALAKISNANSKIGNMEEVSSLYKGFKGSPSQKLELYGEGAPLNFKVRTDDESSQAMKNIFDQSLYGTPKKNLMSPERLEKIGNTPFSRMDYFESLLMKHDAGSPFIDHADEALSSHRSIKKAKNTRRKAGKEAMSALERYMANKGE